MPNTLLTTDVVARESLMILMNNLGIAQAAYRDYTSEFTAAKVGDSIRIRRPATFVANEFTGSAITVQNATESSVALTLEKHYDVSAEVTSKELTLSLQDFSTQFIQPAMVTLAEKIDSYIFDVCRQQVNNFVGTAGTAPTTLGHMAELDRRFNEQKVPTSGRMAFVNPLMKQNILSIADLTRTDARGSNEALRRASLGEIMGFDFFMAQGVQRQTAGTQGGVAGAAINNSGGYAAGVSTINLDGLGTTNTIKTGDVFSIAGVFRPGTNVLAHFVATNDRTASSGAVTGLTFSPALPAAAADDAAVTFIASHDANVLMHRNGLAFVSVPLALPMGNQNASIISFQGLSIRVVFQYDHSLKKDVVSFDTLVGAKVIDQNLMARFIR